MTPVSNVLVSSLENEFQLLIGACLRHGHGEDGEKVGELFLQSERASPNLTLKSEAGCFS